MAAVITVPFDAWFGLVADGSDTEVAGHGYTRQPAHFVYTADGVTIANTAAIQWQKATRDWGGIDLVDIWDSETGGTLLGTLSTATAVDVFQYAIARISPAGISVAIQTSGRPYGTGTYGTLRYATYDHLVPTGSGVVLEITFDTSTHSCSTGVWAPGPFKVAA